MNKIIFVLLGLFAVIAFVACGQGKKRIKIQKEWKRK